MDLEKFVEINEEHVHIDIMHVALTSIANEMQRFYADTPTYYTSENDKMLEKLNKSKLSLKLKKKQVHKLRENLKIACDIAKAVISAKENATALLNTYLVLAKNEGAELFKKQSQDMKIINSLTRENKILRDRIQDIENFIAQGYKELQKIRKEYVKELPVAMQLKKIITCCDKYYTDYYNEHERRMQLERSNRFLCNKTSILENTIEAISEDLRNLRYHNARLLKENNFMKDKYIGAKTFKSIDLICSEYRIENRFLLPSNIPSSIDVDKNPLGTQIHDLDLTSHLYTVKKLLNNQDLLLEDLKDISQEFCVN